MAPDPAAIARASLAQMNEISRRAETGELVFGGDASAPGPSTSASGSSSGSESASNPGVGASAANGTNPNAAMTGMAGDAPFMLPDVSWDTLTHTGHEGLQVFTLGHLLPRSAVDDANGNWTYVGDGENGAFEKEDSPGAEEVVQPTPTNPGGGANGTAATQAASTSATSPSTSSDVGGQQKLRVRRSTFVPGWAVPPRVLLVDDDAVSRRLSSKFLQVFGCAIDVAVDGVGAVNKMNLEKYDLVLMVGTILVWWTTD